MADPQAAVLTQLRNIQARTGQPLAALHAAVQASGLTKVSERRAFVMERFKLGYGDANTVVLTIGKVPPGLDGAPATPAPVAAGDALEEIYSGPKAGLRPLHEAVMRAIGGFGPFEVAPKKSYVSLRRARQFAMVGPATKDAIEIGLNCKDLPADPRLKALPPGGMCQATTRLGDVGQIDAALLGWLRRAYDAAA